MDEIQGQRKLKEQIANILNDYDRSSVRYLRTLDERLTQLGDPAIKVVVK